MTERSRLGFGSTSAAEPPVNVHSHPRYEMSARPPFAKSSIVWLALLALAACQAYTSTASGSLTTHLSFNSVVARPPMRDTAFATGGARRADAQGLLNQTPPCFTLAADAARERDRLVVWMIATEASGTCATFAAGAFAYTVGISELPRGTYDVEVRHRVLFKDGRVTEAVAGGGRIEVQ